MSNRNSHSGVSTNAVRGLNLYPCLWILIPALSQLSPLGNLFPPHKHVNINYQRTQKKHTAINYYHPNINVCRTTRVLGNISEMQRAVKGSMQGLGLSPLERTHPFALVDANTCNSMYWQCLSIRLKQITWCPNLNFLYQMTFSLWYCPPSFQVTKERM